MGTTTPKLQLIKPYESDFVSINDINSNMDKIDNLTHIIAAGTASATYSKINAWNQVGGNVTWYYQKTDDGLLRAWTSLIVTGLRCTSKQAGGEYMSGYIEIKYPSLGQTNIISRSGTVLVQGSVINQVAFYASNPATTGVVGFRLYNYSTKETKDMTKIVYTNFVATWK